MSAIKVNGTWQQVASVKVKRNAVWVDHTAFYSRLEGAWHVIDLNAEAVGPAYHVWKAYADDEQGNGISLLPEGKEYIGFAVGQTTEQPKLADPSIFDWSLIKGTDGEDVDPEVLNEILTKQDDIAVAVDDVESRLKAADGGLASALATAEHNFTVSLNKANALIVTTDERITDGVSRIDTAVEGLDATIKSTDTRLTSNIALADSKIASAATAIGNVQNDITGLSSLTGSHGSAITDLETTTDEQAQRVSVLETSDGVSKARVTTLEKTSVGHASRLSNVETKSTTAVDKADAAQGSANAANTRVTTIANSVTGLEETSEGHASRLTNVETKSTSAVTKADAAQGSANAANTKVATVTSRVTGLEETSTGHASRLTNVETKSTSAVTKADAAQSTADSGVFKADTAQGTANSATAKVSSVTNRVGTLEETSTGHASRLTNVETTSTTAESKADDAQDAADLAQATADSGVLDAGAAQGTANAATTKVTSVTNRVGTLEETSTGHASRLTNVETTATTATTKADDAQDTADSGVSKANAAQGTANLGVSKANTAQAKANSVDTKVTTVTNRVGTLEETSTGHASRLTNVETKSTSAVTKAGDAQDTADSGVSKANAAQAKANAATTIATAATNRVSTLEETSEGHASRLSTVETTAITAVTKADDAQDTADSGVGKAAAAQSTANSGVSKANAAQAKANSATTKVTAVTNRVGTLEETSTGHASRLTNVETTATTATTKADDAQDTADSGVGKANAAQAKANSADGKVNTVTNRVSSLEETSEDYATRFTSVETTSESGVSKANVAQSTANSGVSKANAAQVTANSGVSKANAAKGLADEAQDTADSGVSKANAAQAKANSADSKVNKVTNRVGTLEETSTGHASRLSTVETKATTGVSKANTAQSTANSGVSKANAAQDTADSGVSKANAAQAKANSADSKVNTVTNRVGTLESTSTTHASRLSTVETKATMGVSKADAAQLKADYVGRTVSNVDQKTNLLKMEQWIPQVDGQLAGFPRNGSSTESKRISGIGPYGSTVLWKSVSAGDDGSNGGWTDASFPADRTKTYRFVTWYMRDPNAPKGVGSTYLGTNTCLSLSGKTNSNPYFKSFRTSSLDSWGIKQGEWYCIIGHMHFEGYTGGVDSSTGVYNERGEKVAGATDYKFYPTATSIRHRAYYYYETVKGATQFFAEPRLEIVDGTELPLSELLTTVRSTALKVEDKVTAASNRVSTLEETSTGHASRLSTVETKATTGVSKANAAQSTANSGVSKANAAQNTANAANTKVTAVTNRVSTLESTSSTHASRLSTVETKATTGVSKANAAQSTANSGVSKANTAQSKANTATTKADTAQDAAEAAQGTANTAKTNATSVSNRVSTLESTSTTHASRLSTVETKATSGVSKANTAQSTANSGVSKATAAQNTANSGVSKANTAQSTANTGVSNAAKAQAKANSADSKVNAATNRVSTLETSDLDKARRISTVESIAAKSSEYTLNSANNVVPDVHSALDSSADSGAANLKAGFRVTGSRDGFSREFFQVNPDRSYEIRVRARQAVNSSDNSNRLYAGVAPYDANKKEVARPSGGAGTYLYAAASPKILPTDGTWREYSAIMTGVGMSSRNFREGTRYVRLMFIASHIGKGSPVVDIEYLEIRDVTEVNAVDSRVSVIETASNANASRIESVNASQGKAVASAKDIARAYTDTKTNVLKAERVIKADANGKVSGVHLLSKGSGVDAGGKLYFQADEIAIVPPNWNGSSELDKSKFPFYFSEDRNYMYLDEAVIRQLSAETIDSGRLAVDGIAILSDDITMPPGAIREHMIDPAFKDGIVRVSPDGVVLGGTQSVTSKGVGFNKKISVPALKSGGSAQKMNFSVSGPNEAGLKDVAFDVTMKLNGAAHNFTVGKATIRLSANINYSTEEGGHRLYRTSFNFSEQVILPAPTKGLEYTYEFTISNITFNPKSVVSYNYADKLFFAVSVSEPTVSSGGFITDVRWKDVKEQPSYLGIDTSGSSSYPRMFPANNPASSNSWVRTTSAGLLPYANNKSNLGTISWKFKEVHSVNFYENGVSLGSKYLGKTTTAVNADKLDNINSSQFLRSDKGGRVEGQLTIRHTNVQLNLMDSTFEDNYWQFDHQNGILGFRYNGGEIAFQLNKGGTAAFTHEVSAPSFSEGGTKLSSKYLGKTATATNAVSASNADKLSGKLASSTGTANSIALRNSSGDTFSRLFRSTYQNESSIGGAIAFRNSTSDNYIRFCSNMSAVRAFVDVYSKGEGNARYAAIGHTHDGRYYTEAEADSRFVNSVNGTATGTLKTKAINAESTLSNPFRWQRSSNSQVGQDDNVSVYLDDSNIYFTHNNDDDGDASGYHFRFMSGGNAVSLLSFYSGGITYRGNAIWHSANDGSGSGLDADKLDGLHASSFSRSDHGHTGLSSNAWGGITSRTAGGVIEFGPANGSYAHIYTDRPSFYFNKELTVNGSQVYHTGNKPSPAAIGALALTGGLITGDLSVKATTHFVAPNGSKQRVDTRNEGIEGRAHWYGLDSSGGTRRFMQAWYDGSSYVNVDVVGKTVLFGGAVDVQGGLKQDGHTILNGSDTWIRTEGEHGIYFSSFGGGLYMTDATWVRTYAGKSFFSSSTNTLESIKTDGGIRFKHQLYSTNPTGEGGIVGYYATLGSSKDQMIWTIGSDWRTHAKHYGLGYHYGSEIDGGNKHQLVLKQNGVIGTYLAMNGHARFNGVVNAKATTGVISRVITYDDFLPSTPPAGLENTITASWIGAGAINARHLQVNSLVNNGGSYTSLKIAPDAVRPIALSRTDSAGKEISPIFYVDTKGNGFFDGKLSKNTVDIESIQDEARRQINPYYVGTVAGGTQSGTDKSLNSGGTYVLPAITVLGGKVNLSWVVSGSTSYRNGSGKQAYSTPNWRIEVFRGTTSNTRIVNRTYTGTSFQHLDNEYGSPSYGRWEGSSSIHIDDQISDNYAASGQRYTIRVTRLSGTSMAILVRSFTGSSPAFKRIEMKYDYTSLYYNAAGLANGNITLADDYDKYEFLAVEGSEDNDDVMGITLIPTYTITADVGKFDDKQFMLSSPLYDKYWRVSLQGKRSLIERGENSLIRRIWGVNIVEKV
ncbi:hypothetical protein [Pseudoalteromonas sp. SWYJZ19]|uniref:hypothetical protein n=1 Tax=Pseudoalteromonas sp. SWYJZ19 TaxID=2792068 RepID=UPI0018CDEA72|nr:hypothetical protein [Pseudoalteromonas sp. SWYJZ19]MBH0050723.1 hypothetical protein [Pseudoalteromonas sp. SWYJZ19]